MVRFFLVLISFLFPVVMTMGQYEVPTHMTFAGLELSIHHSAKNEIQGYVDKLVKSKKYHQQFVDLANTYFPVIEPIFDEIGLPQDFKYLIIQESAFIGDAVSSSNAVGYWQMKKPTAQELGLRVDGTLDERKNIVSATRAAATYLKKNNKKLDNWCYALLSYNLGPTGVLKEVKQKDVGASKMVINKGTHWYIKKCLAHKIAFENDLASTTPPQSILLEWETAGKSLKQFSRKHNVDQEELEKFNKWIGFSKKIPSDKTYAVAIPVPYDPVLAKGKVVKSEAGVVTVEVPKENPRPNKGVSVTSYKDVKSNIRYTVNGIPVIVAKSGDTPSKLANIAGISTTQFLKYNELESFSEITEGESYYLKSKKGKALVAFHTVQSGETVSALAHQYGIKERSIRSKNRMQKNEALKPGRVIWLRSKRPKDTPVEFKFDKQKIETPQEVEKVEKKAQPVLAPKVEIPEGALTHKVGLGETLYRIAVKHGVTMAEIRKWNKLSSDDLSIGQVLIVGMSVQQDVAETPSVTTVKKHVVKPGDTLYSLAREYNVEVSQIRAWNKLSTNALSVGQELIIQE